MSIRRPAASCFAAALLITAVIAGCGDDPLFTGDRLARTARPDVETSEQLRDTLEERAEDWLDDPGLCLALSWHYYEDGDLGDARDILEESVDEKPHPATLLQYAYFTEYGDGRADLCREVLELDPDSAQAYVGLGDALLVESLEDRDPELRWEAYRAFSKSYEKEPFRRIASWNMVVFKRSIGHDDSAARLLEHLIGAWLWPVELADEDSTAAYYAALASIYAGSPQWADAVSRYRRHAQGAPKMRPAAGRVENPPPRPFDERPFLGLELDGTDADGLPVVATVIGGSTAAACGVRPGDRIVVINSVPVMTTEDADATVQALTSESMVRIVIRRGDVEAELSRNVVTGARWLDTAMDALRRAHDLYVEESWEEAAQGFAAALAIVPQNQLARLYHVSSLYRARLFEDAARLADRYLDDAPRQFHLNEMLVLSLNAQGRHVEAQHVAERLLRWNPANGTFEALLGLQYFNLGRPDDAAKRFERAALFGRGGEPARILAKMLDDHDKQSGAGAGDEADAVWSSLLLGAVRGSLDSGGSSGSFAISDTSEEQARSELIDEAARRALARELWRQPPVTTW